MDETDGACGTTTGYGRHCRRGTEPCQACRDAQAARMRKKRQEGYKAPEIPADVLAGRLLTKSVVVDGGCRRWTGAHEHKGYGQISVGPRLRPVHAVAYEIWVGPIPEGYEIDHVYAAGCRYRDCIEPSHLEAVTHAENIRRMNEARRARQAVNG